MNKYIIITSIFSPTEAIRKFASLSDFQLIVVGDKKTPEDWHCKNVKFLSVKDQNEIGVGLDGVLPYNHYCRKMMGYLWAINNGADIIIDTDDDNIPKENWIFPDITGEFETVAGNQSFINIYQLYTKQKIWARGLPLNLINTKFDFDKLIKKNECKVGVWQGLADEDPDVDAIYRLTSDQACSFTDRSPIVLGKGTISPFNSQNTLIIKELFPLLYLPTYVTFRFTDILRGLIAQPIMWLYDYHLGFTNATVIQKRNPHDYFKDFLSEMPMYQYTEDVIELVSNSISKNETISANLYNAYASLLKKDIVCSKEMQTLDAWLKDIHKS